MVNKLNIQSLNIRGGRDLWKRRSIFEFLEKQKYYFIMLQECDILESELNVWKQDWVGRYLLQPIQLKRLRPSDFTERQERHS